MKERIEKDSLGVVKIPGNAYWGKETQRALKEGRTVAEVAREMTKLSTRELKELLDPKRMT